MKSLTICTLVVCLGLLHAGNVLGQSADQDAVAATFSRPTPPSQPVKLELVGYANKDIVPGTEQVTGSFATLSRGLLFYLLSLSRGNPHLGRSPPVTYTDALVPIY